MKFKNILLLLSTAFALTSCASLDISILRKKRIKYASTQEKGKQHVLVGQLTTKDKLIIYIDDNLIIDKQLSLSGSMQRSSASGVYANEPIIVNCYNKGYTTSTKGTQCAVTVGPYQVGILDFGW